MNRTVYLLAASKHQDIRKELLRECRYVLASWERELDTISARYQERQAALQAEYLKRMETVMGCIARLKEAMDE